MSVLDPEQLLTLKRMTGADRVKVAMGLNAEARKIKAANLRRKHKQWSEERIQEEVKRIFLHATT